MMSNIYVGMRTFRKAIIGPEVYEVEHFVLVNDDARLMPTQFAKSRYKTRVATDLAWGYAGASPLALAHSILWIELRDAENGYEIATQRYIPFMGAFIANMPVCAAAKEGTFAEWKLTSATIHDWLSKQPIILEQNKFAGF